MTLVMELSDGTSGGAEYDVTHSRIFKNGWYYSKGKQHFFISYALLYVFFFLSHELPFTILKW